MPPHGLAPLTRRWRPRTTRRCGIWRKGAWGGTNGTLWPHYDTVGKATDAASDHAAIYADVTLL
jgi:hypothetical protein